ncbi:GNAT family N-acetyltransferase [Winogradskya consettensis]|uniref:N-acetyltransferase n=1 Tax=Winogradskya consettensis TaxID=113560 RepID=A0A919VPJ0_9ACTN|nr:GNAT family N-acetyltransferase [Actinoplanes consettensis]GIM73899.1 N-acetyltransferase [Actinoplanes consettensis]
MLHTDRLLLRRWRPSDRAPFAAMNADPVVMRHFPATLSADRSDAMADRLSAAIDSRGWGFWAVELVATGDFCGFVGIRPVPETLLFAPAVEIGWRIAPAYRGQGLAPEAGCAAIAYAFSPPAVGGPAGSGPAGSGPGVGGPGVGGPGVGGPGVGVAVGDGRGVGGLGLGALVALTTREDVASRRVMEKIGMRYDPADDFIHPTVPQDWPQRDCVLYRLINK